MKTDTLISVIIPTYNSEKYIRECLDATISQTYKSLEILIVDNCSSDDTLKICDEYARRDDRIHVFENPKIGVSFSRNFGINHSHGDYVVFFDSDDYPEKDLIENYVTACRLWNDKDVSFILCGMFFDNEINRNVGDIVSILESGHGYIEGERYLLARSSVATLSWLKLFNFVTNKLYCLDVIKEKRIMFDENVNIGEDLKFNLDYLDNCNGCIGVINKPLYHYIRRDNNSLSLTYHENDIEDTKSIYERLIDWEGKQKGATEENLLVLKAIYINDWISRMTTYYEHFKGNSTTAKYMLCEELKSHKFRQMLTEVYKAKKISTLRYVCLKTGIYDFFYFFRGIYQIMKG
jgi:glycosyltransferase involved in cell wall biosynthesis